MNDTMPLDLCAVNRTGPFDPEQLVEYALRQLEDDAAIARARSQQVFNEGGAVLHELFAAYKAQADARDAIDRAEEESLHQLRLLVGPDLEVDVQTVSERIDQLSDQAKRLAASASQLGEYHLSQWGRYTQLGKCLKQFMAILPAMRRQVRRARVLSLLGRATALVAALGATILIEMALTGLAEELLGRLVPSYAKVLAVAVLFLLGLVAIEKPLGRWLGSIHWRLFERIRNARATNLKRIQELESSLKTLVIPGT